MGEDRRARRRGRGLPRADAPRAFIDESVRLDHLDQAIEQAREKLTVPLRLVLVDYLGLLAANGRDAYERASLVGRELKTIAKRQKVAIVVATQVSRAEATVPSRSPSRCFATPA